MENTDEYAVLKGGSSTPAAQLRLLIQEAQDVAEYVQWSIEWVELSRSDYAELRLHARALQQIALDMRDIVRRKRPPVGF